MAGVSIVGLLATLFSLALVDSINPCAISTAILVSANAIAVGYGGRQRYIPLIAFSLGVYTGYYIVGYFASILAYHTIFLSIIVAVAVIMIARDIHGLRTGRISDEIKCEGRECLPRFIMHSSKPVYPMLLLFFGMIVSWSFMMCSAAPYLVFIALLSHTEVSQATKALLIAIYCMVIIAPIIAAGIAGHYIVRRIMFNMRRLVLLRVITLSIIVGFASFYLFSY